MAEFLLELLSEEIPAGMQEWGRKHLEESIKDALADEGLIYTQVPEFFSTPKRLIIYIKSLSDSSPKKETERKGPSVDAPQQAIDGFCKSCGIKKDDLRIRANAKGRFYTAPVIHEGRPTKDILPEILPDIIRKFPWPKSMLWGDGDFRWVRPLHSITAILDGKPLVFEVGGIKSGNHSIKDFADYSAKLKEAGIILDQKERINKILDDAQTLCEKEELRFMMEYRYLIDEIAGLVESPFCIMGKIDKQFLDLPLEVLQVSMGYHQKFLSVANAKGKITHFITVANKHKPSKSAQQTILAGNQKVLSARLADAKFFWENDKRTAKEGMKTWEEQLEKITFHNKLGTQRDRVNRIAEFVKAHAGFFKVKPDDAKKSAEIMKLDLCSDMVKEFPELQGFMGYYYAKEAGYNPSVAWACQEHYDPRGLNDDPPQAESSILMALADRLDTLAGFWSVGIIPTSSGDKFALRRAALGVIRIILDSNWRLSLTDLLDTAFKPFANKAEPEAQDKLMNFFHERLKIYLGDYKNEKIPADTIDACRFGQGETDFALLTNRAKALHAFRPDAEFQNLLQGFKRAHNILHAEQKKDGVFFEMPPEPQYFQDPTETELYTALNAAETTLPPLMQKEQFAQMLQTLANLRAPIDAFFTEVQVNSDQSAVRRNRLCLLHKLCSVMKTFADFSRLNG